MSISPPMKGPAGQRDIYDLAVVGGGPIGSYAALSMARLGINVVLFEEHHQFGRPVQCAGLVNDGILRLPYMEEIDSGYILNRIKGADVFSPSGNVLRLRGADTKALSIDRHSFDLAMGRIAVESGVDAMMGKKVLGIEPCDGGFLIRTRSMEGIRSFKARSVFLCDGPNPSLKRSLGIAISREVVPGISCEIQVRSHIFDEHTVAVMTGRKLAPGFFAWAVPSGEDGKVKIGLASSYGGDLRDNLRSLLQDRRLSSWLTDDPDGLKYSELSLTFGSIPIGPVEVFQRKGILTLGDASGMAKATSGGGVYPGMLSVKVLGDVVKKHGQGITDPVFETFSREWRKGYGSELDRTFRLRSIIEEIEEPEIDIVLAKLSSPELNSYINKNGDIDRPFTLAMGLVKRDPSLLGLIPRFFPRLLRVLR